MSAGFAERGPVPTEDGCQWCGGKLRPTDTFGPGIATGEYGYSGQGYFCSLRCGWHFGLRMAELGKRLRPTREARA